MDDGVLGGGGCYRRCRGTSARLGLPADNIGTVEKGKQGVEVVDPSRWLPCWPSTEWAMVILASKSSRGTFAKSCQPLPPTSGRARQLELWPSAPNGQQGPATAPGTQWASRPQAMSHQDRRSTRPGRDTVWRPSRTTTCPLTITSLTPIGGWDGFIYVDVSVIVIGSKTVRSANVSFKIMPRSRICKRSATDPVILRIASARPNTVLSRT